MYLIIKHTGFIWQTVETKQFKTFKSAANMLLSKYDMSYRIINTKEYGLVDSYMPEPTEQTNLVFKMSLEERSHD